MLLPPIKGETESENDVCISTATGSGKTFAYGIALLEYARRAQVPGISAIVLAPTSDLAEQVCGNQLKQKSSACVVGLARIERLH